MPFDATRTVRGAFAGSVAAGVWLAARRLRVPAVLRHVLFGFVLGGLERRLNPPEAELRPVDEASVASNGHGSAAHLVATGPVDH
jgi:hypothetical protein